MTIYDVIVFLVSIPLGLYSLHVIFENCKNPHAEEWRALNGDDGTN